MDPSWFCHCFYVCVYSPDSSCTCRFRAQFGFVHAVSSWVRVQVFVLFPPGLECFTLQLFCSFIWDLRSWLFCFSTSFGIWVIYCSLQDYIPLVPSGHFSYYLTFVFSLLFRFECFILPFRFYSFSLTWIYEVFTFPLLKVVIFFYLFIFYLFIFYLFIFLWGD